MDQSYSLFNSDNDPSVATGTATVNAVDTKKNSVAVSLSQVVHCTRKDDGLVIHQNKVHTLTTVGLVLGVNEVTTKVIYTIDDQSLGSPVEVQFWKNDDEMEGLGTSASNGPPNVMEKTYVRVYGQARHDDKKPFIVAFKIIPILNPNEIIMHHLEVIHDSLVLEHRKKDALCGRTEPIGAGAGAGGYLSGDGNNGNSFVPGFNDLQKIVMNLITEKSRTNEAGIHVNEVCAALSRSASKEKILKTIDFLAQEGHIFSTTDEFTFKSTDY